MPPSTHSLDDNTAIEHSGEPASHAPTPVIGKALERTNSKTGHTQSSEEGDDDDHDNDSPPHTTASNSASTSQRSLVTATGRQSTTQSRQRRQTRDSRQRGGPTESISRTSGRAPTFRSIRRAATTLLHPEKKLGQAPGVLRSLKAIFFASWLNLLLVFIPISWAMNFALEPSNNKDTLVFVFAFLAIIPLAKLLGFATEELSLRVGQTLAGLLNATLGNAVELIVAIIALVKCDLRIVQASLVGSILSNLLLVLGMCFFAGGIKYQEQGFGASASQLNSSLLTISVIAVLLPAAFHFAAPDTLGQAAEGRDILAVSRGTAVILLVIYGGYLLFQLWSHATLYQDDHADVIKSTEYAFKKKRREKKVAKKRRYQEQQETEKSEQIIPNGVFNQEPEPIDPPTRVATSTSVSWAPGTNPGRDEEQGSTDVESFEEQPQMSVWMTLALLVVITVLVAVTAEFLVDSIHGLTEQNTISQEFVGIILLPIVGNAAEHVTAVTVSVKDKLTLSLGVAVGSSIQIALFVIPVIVILGWIIGKPMTLLFDPYESIVLFFSVLTVNYVVQDGKSNWLEGFILMLLYFILGLTFWFYPGSDPSGGLLTQCARPAPS